MPFERAGMLPENPGCGTSKFELLEIFQTSMFIDVSNRSVTEKHSVLKIKPGNGFRDFRRAGVR